MYFAVFYYKNLQFFYFLGYNIHMFVKKVTLKNYRNYENRTFEFQPDLNVVFGANAVGKTNLMESIYLCAVGKSPKNSKDKDLIRFDTTGYEVSVDVAKKYRTHNINYRCNDKKEKRIAVNNLPLSKIGELMGVLNVVYFSPDELKMIKESPQERRRFMDISLCQQSKPYFYTLSRYNKILENRNSLLKEKSLSYIEQTLPIWDAQLAHEGAIVIESRKKFIQTINPITDKIHKSITNGKSFSLTYETNVEGEIREDIEKSLLEKLSANHIKEKELGHTLIGPHRDDFSIMSEGIELRSFGSQGQQRTASLVIKLAELEYFEKETGEKPVLILDDVLSELDENRRSNLLLATSGYQTILTCTDYKESVAANLIHIE